MWGWLHCDYFDYRELATGGDGGGMCNCGVVWLGLFWCVVGCGVVMLVQCNV